VIDQTSEVGPLDGALPCPFCGGTKISTYPGSTFRWRYAACDECGAQSGEVRINTTTKSRMKAMQEAQDELRSEWNKRSPRK
jgi:Lar family restriction alleviation protein